jgi:triosephosphate isomerase
VTDSGAYTGQISGPMLAKLGCTYVTVGHSERREYNGETDDVVNAKAKAALRNDLTPIVCMGEGLPIRQSGEQVPYVLAQLDADLHGLTPEQVAGLVIAYEPVWAIGTGEVATPEDAQEVCGAIRARVKETFGADVAAAVRILYGGSPTSPASWPSRTLMGPSSAGRASTRTSSSESCDSGFTRPS